MDDAPTLLKLAKMVHFINLPADPDIINAKIGRSRKSFNGQLEDNRERQFMFAIEDTETRNIIGTSLIVSAISWPGKPNIYFQVRKREHYSEDLQTGTVHTTLQLCTDESGPSEIGGLILSPSYRGHPEKLGSLLSLIRFHYVGLHREWFSERIMAEMMAPLTPDSRNSLWDYLGRRFINLRYAEADSFCQHSKEFMTSLLPKTEIYVSLLPPEARRLIGKVGSETIPARKMLEALGFKYRGQVDPFDGGPYLDANVEDIDLIVNTKTLTLGEPSENNNERAFVSVENKNGFRAARSPCTIKGKSISIPQEYVDELNVSTGDTVGVSLIPSKSERTESDQQEPEISAT